LARIDVVVLAAGEASRFGSPKQKLLLPDVLRALSEATEELGDLVVVEGAHPLDEALSNRLLLSASRVRLVACSDWARGPGASLRCGLAALGGDTEAALVVLADGPELDPRAIDRVVAAWREGRGDLLAASYDGTRDHPLLVARALWSDVPDEGLRVREPLLVPCDDLRAPGDVDRPEDLPERLR
jgi:CTP:molybdopterin cytidylyltransferase MocA